MDKNVTRMINIGIACCGPLFVIGYIFCWGVLGHNIPPPNMMAMTPEQLVADYYLKYQNDIAMGMIGCCVIGLLYLPWSMLLASMMREDDKSHGVLSMMESSGGLLTAWLLAFCPAIWATCALLAGSVPDYVVKAIHMFTWIIYDCTFMITTVQLAGLGLYTVFNKKQTIFPAWTGWCAIAVGIIFVPLVLMPFVLEGPFAVSGTWNFYLVFGSWFFAFFAPYTYYMLKETLGYNASRTPGLVQAHG